LLLYILLMLSLFHTALRNLAQEGSNVNFSLRKYGILKNFVVSSIDLILSNVGLKLLQATFAPNLRCSLCCAKHFVILGNHRRKARGPRKKNSSFKESPKIKEGSELIV